MSKNPDIILDDDVKQAIDEALKPKKKVPRNCSTCAVATKLCGHCDSWCPHFAFGSKCGHSSDRKYRVASFWRKFGGKGDCPVWEG